MNGINFINPVPPSENNSGRRWVFISSLIISGITMYILFLGPTEGYIYYKLIQARRTAQNETAHGSAIAQKRSEKELQFSQKQHQYQKISNYKTTPKNPEPLLMSISKIINPSNIQSCSFTQRSFEINCLASHAQEAQKYIHQLAQLPELKEVTLVSLYKENNKLKTTIRGIIDKKKSRS